MPAHAPLIAAMTGLRMVVTKCGWRAPDKLAHVGVRGGVDGGGADRAQVAHVGARAEGAPTSGDDDGPDVGIGLGVVET